MFKKFFPQKQVSLCTNKDLVNQFNLRNGISAAEREKVLDLFIDSAEKPVRGLKIIEIKNNHSVFGLAFFPYLSDTTKDKEYQIIKARKQYKMDFVVFSFRRPGSAFYFLNRGILVLKICTWTLYK